MAIPPFTAQGLLPNSIHDCTLGEIYQCFVVDLSSPSRTALWATLQSFVTEVGPLGIVSAIYVDGGFTSNKVDTKDIDVAIELPTKDSMRADGALARQVKNFLNNFRAFRGRWYNQGIDVYPRIPPIEPWENDLTLWFQYINPKDFAGLGLSSSDRKGVLRIIT